MIVGSGVIPSHEQTVISLLARGIFGDGPLYYLIQGSTVLILVLAANTAYADFPRLGSLLARDDYAPHQLAFRGDRLAFTNGIILLGALSALLIVLFGGSTGALLPLYALSVFAAFTLSQAGMVRHWLRERGRHWLFKAGVNGVGATLTGLVALIAAATNFMNPALPIVPWLPIGWGSWVVVVIVPAFIWLFRKVHQHYAEAGSQPGPVADPGRSAAQESGGRTDLAPESPGRPGAPLCPLAVDRRHGNPRDLRRNQRRRAGGRMGALGPGGAARRSSNRPTAV